MLVIFTENSSRLLKGRSPTAGRVTYREPRSPSDCTPRDGSRQKHTMLIRSSRNLHIVGVYLRASGGMASDSSIDPTDGGNTMSKSKLGRGKLVAGLGALALVADSLFSPRLRARNGGGGWWWEIAAIRESFLADELGVTIEELETARARLPFVPGLWTRHWQTDRSPRVKRTRSNSTRACSPTWIAKPW